MKFITTILTLLLLPLTFYSDARAANYNKVLRFDTQWDSVQILTYIDMATGQDDSTTIFTTNVDTSIVLDDNTDYSIIYKYWASGSYYAATETILHNRLKPTTAGRTLDVLATGEAGVDLDNTSGDLAAADFEASSLDGKGDWSTHSAANVWAAAARTLTELDEDNTTIDLNGTEVYRLVQFDEDFTTIDIDGQTIAVATTATNLTNNNDKTGYSLTTAERAAIEDSVHGNAADYKATGFSTHNADAVWAVGIRALTDKANFALSTTAYNTIKDSVWRNTDDYRWLTSLDEDTTTIDIDGQTIATVTTATNLSNNNDKTGYTLTVNDMQIAAGHAADSVWNADTASHNGTANSFGILFDASVSSAGGSATISDADMGAIIDSLMRRIVADTITGSWAGRVLSEAASGGAGISDDAMGDIIDSLMRRVVADTISGSWVGRVLSYAAGASTFDVATDSTLPDISKMIASGLLAAIEDTVHANAADYKATGFSTHAAADVWSVATRALTDKAGFGLSTAERAAIEDSVHANAADYKADVSGLSTFDPTTDSTLPDISSLVDNGFCSVIEDSIHANAADYKATGFSTFAAATDSVIVDVSAASVEDGLLAKQADSIQAVALKINADNTSGSFDAADFEANVWLATHFHSNVGEEFAAATWAEDLSTYSTQYTAGSIVYDSIDAKVSSAGATATIADADMAAIVDSIMRRAASDTVTASWTAAVIRKSDSAASGATATIADADMGAIIDSLMRRAAGDTISGSWVGLMLSLADAGSTFDPSVTGDSLDINDAVADALATWGKSGFSLTSTEWEEVWRNIDTNNVDSSDIGVWIGNAASGSATISDADKKDIAQYVKDTATAYPSIFYGPTATGGGLYSVTVYAVDTSGTDAVVPAVSIAAQTTDGIPLAGPLVANNQGNVTFMLDAGVTRFISRLGASYQFDTLSATITGNEDSLAVLGYNVVIDPPAGGASYATVYASLYKPNGTADSGIVVKGWLMPDINVTASTPGYTITPYAIWDTTDASGYWSIDLMRSDQYDDTTKGWYHIEGTKGRNRRKVFVIDSLRIPESGNVDLTDSLAAR